MPSVRFIICLSFLCVVGFFFFTISKAKVIDFESKFLNKKVICASRFAKSK